MPWITDADLKTAVASVHKLASAASLPGHWTAIVARANSRAYHRLRRILANKGYSFADLDTWAERVDFNVAGGLCYALREGGLPEGQEGLSLSNYCKVWEEVEALGTLYAEDGEPLPFSNLGASISFGGYSTAHDTFTRETEL